MNVRRLDMPLTPGHLPIDFQIQAMEFIKSNNLVQNPKYFVISDNMEAAKSELENYNADITYISGTANLGLNGLNLLSKCANNIQTVSTYSWWGTFLNQQGGFTIAPCDYIDLHKHNGPVYKIQYSINNEKHCDYSYKMLYKKNGKNTENIY